MKSHEHMIIIFKMLLKKLKISGGREYTRVIHSDVLCEECKYKDRCLGDGSIKCGAFLNISEYGIYAWNELMKTLKYRYVLNAYKEKMS